MSAEDERNAAALAQITKFAESDYAEALRETAGCGVQTPTWESFLLGYHLGFVQRKKIEGVMSDASRIKCPTCHGNGYRDCDDPQYSDSTWDHDCNAGRRCDECRGSGEVEAAPEAYS